MDTPSRTRMHSWAVLPRPCMHACPYALLHTRKHTRTLACMPPRTRTHTHPCMNAHTHAHAHVQSCINTRGRSMATLWRSGDIRCGISTPTQISIARAMDKYVLQGLPPYTTSRIHHIITVTSHKAKKTYVPICRCFSGTVLAS